MRSTLDWQQFWMRRGAANIALLPLSLLFIAAAHLRRRILLRRRRAAPPLPPIVIVGNIVAGGGGKTPIVIALARVLTARGFRPGIICRGVGGKTPATHIVSDHDDWRQIGDEALLLRRQTGLPVCADKNRLRAAATLAKHDCDLLISDDGLQRADLPRAIKIAVTSARTGFGNGWRLPAGPLRESPDRLTQCDLLLLTHPAEDPANAPPPAGEHTLGKWRPAMHSVPRRLGPIYATHTPHTPLPPTHFTHKRVAALAAIAHPSAFFHALTAQGIPIAHTIALPDHTALSPAEIAAIDCDAIITTEKDAVKYSPATPRLHAAPLAGSLPPQALEIILQKIRQS